MFKIDLHTHSVASKDGGLSADDYKRKLARGDLDYIAITDHDKIDFAKQLAVELGDKIIVGEEIEVQEGEIIGLYLTESIKPGLSAKDAMAKIHGQGGLVYIPHPFETVRKGLSENVLNEIADLVDIVEVHNGRAIFQNKTTTALFWAAKHQKAYATSSDAHGWKGWGKTFSVVDPEPTKDNLVGLLSHATHIQKKAGLLGALYPKWNRFRKKHGRA
ncbi:MAG TPA: PHP domain-containing protein [Candidatus Saccharimonadales bacterium]|nr:PHP domain-containing protein [Candidatus Saccharimonadales bacterium]